MSDERINKAAKLYVYTKIRHTKCMQQHFVQQCYRCDEFSRGCKLYARMSSRWMKLEQAVNRKNSDV